MLTIAYDPIYAHPLPEGHRFPMLKYELIPGQLLYEGIITEANELPFDLKFEKDSSGKVTDIYFKNQGVEFRTMRIE